MEIISESDTQAVVLGHVVQNDGTYVAKIFSLSKMKKGENKNCWMVSDIENESMPEVLVPSPIYSPTNVQKIVLMYLRQNPPEGDLDGTENIALAYRFFKRDASSTFEPFAHSVQDHPILNQFERVKPMTIKSVNNMTTIESTIITRSGNEIRLEMGMVQATQRGCEDCWFVQILSIYGDDNAATHSFDSLDGSDKGLILRSLHIIRKHPILQLLAACIVVSCFVMAFLVTLRIAEVVADGVLGEQQRVSTMESPHSHYKVCK
ncbi:hypothetical protein SARC_04395 [Sphaeroforma arctica JP610]|uniref:Uncharacterized protein n=1 Tax=Sphaeroforma arctica JP610 TaxID=667725 RepID=A0A0L0G4Z5_9EUKA|nr:hypothetical protein SARC_04395 [Sphaeroforma arctica JP610]KNC83343.1 hypothetical protein SARC_04395 [Sphaeroforma arctica JP610]|eukprot:XP_014157245.1 hypothetical protein SARC_04395 [Sphaeroforma arctica JP610]